MGFLYVKVIETKKVAVRNSFFVNYPFVRVVVGKEKKSTNFKPGVEWWDKIFTFRGINRGEHQQLYLQARDKSIHVFGSDWLGEVKLDLDTENLLDGRVHQMWQKLGRGKKPHSRSPRGYIQVAFQYVEDGEPRGSRPFSVAPVEPVLTFEEWLAANNKNWASDSSAWFSEGQHTVPQWKAPGDPTLAKSAPAIPNSNSISPDPVRSRSKTVGGPDSPNMDDINPDSQRETKKAQRPRAMTLPEIRSPSIVRRDTTVQSNDDSDIEEDEPLTGNLIDLSFDAPRDKMNGHSQSMRVLDTKSLSVDERVSQIKRLSLSMTTIPSKNAEPMINHEPTFAEWYNPNGNLTTGINPHNPFLSMHEGLAPSTSVGN